MLNYQHSPKTFFFWHLAWYCSRHSGYISSPQSEILFCRCHDNHYKIYRPFGFHTSLAWSLTKPAYPGTPTFLSYPIAMSDMSDRHNVPTQVVDQSTFYAANVHNLEYDKVFVMYGWHLSKPDSSIAIYSPHIYVLQFSVRWAGTYCTFHSERNFLGHQFDIFRNLDNDIGFYPHHQIDYI